MEIKIEKIENGFLVTLGNRRMHATCGEEICGLTSQWVLDECEQLDKVPAGNTKYGDIADRLRAAVLQAPADPSKRFSNGLVTLPNISSKQIT